MDGDRLVILCGEAVKRCKRIVINPVLMIARIQLDADAFLPLQMLLHKRQRFLADSGIEPVARARQRKALDADAVMKH